MSGPTFAARSFGVPQDDSLHACTSSFARPLELHLRHAGVLRVGPAVVRDRRGPAGAERVLVVGVAAELFVQLRVLAELVAVEAHAKARARRHLDAAVL